MIEALSWDGWKQMTDAFVENVRYNLSGDLEPMMDEIERSLERIQSRLNRIRENGKNARGDFLELRRANLILNHAHAFLEQERSARGERVIWRLSRQGQHAVLTKINGDLDLLPSGHEKPWFRYHAFELEDGSSFLVTSASPEVEPGLEAAIRDMQGTRWKLPFHFEKASLPAASSQIRRLLHDQPARIRESRAELQVLSSQWGANLGAVYVLLNERLEQLLMEVSAGENEDFFILEGWIPERGLERTRTVLEEDFGEAVLLRSRPPRADVDGPVPTALRNRSLLRPFELFLKLLRIPDYHAYDPTPLIGLFFPFFAGCMVGDIGYGILVLWLGWHLKQKRSEVLHDVGVILIFVAFWSAAWGVMFGEFFGDVGHRLLHMEPLWVDRAHAVLPVMVFSVITGGVHVLLGLLIGMIQGIRNRHRHLWMERAGSLLFILSLVSALALLRAQLPSAFFSVPVVLLIFALIFLIWGGGVGGIIESLGAVGNIISYVRIAAIGLSSAILAMVASTFVDIFGVSILGLFMAFAIHLLNFVLAIGGSGLHSARLHYVEFMGKFYENGTLAYKPFAKKRRFE
jgi:V/A-type H+-transporting ATPase subunit I